MEPRIIELTEKTLVGKQQTMSLADNKTAELWSAFMPLRRNIPHAINPNLYSIQVYNADYFENFNPHNTFEKWAAIEVSDWSVTPAEMETFTLPDGLYAVFHYKGLSTSTSIFQYIFTSWLPNSGYVLDNRPHFELLGEKYKNNDPDSEEEIWIPIKQRWQ